MSSYDLTVSIPTYKRPELLKECLAHIKPAEGQKIEVIVGNNDVEKPYLREDFDQFDFDLRIVNNEENLGQHRSMNKMLSEARGEFFTWIADDDYHATDFFKSLELIKSSNSKILFTGISQGHEPVFDSLDQSQVIELPPEEFLEQYICGEIFVIGNYGIWNTRELQKIGGMPKIGGGIGPGSDNLLALLAPASGSVCFVRSKLVFFRHHDESLSYTSKDADSYLKASRELVERLEHEYSGISILKERFNELKPVLLNNLFYESVFSIMERSRSVDSCKIYIKLLRSILEDMRTIGWTERLWLGVSVAWKTLRLLKRRTFATFRAES